MWLFYKQLVEIKLNFINRLLKSSDSKFENVSSNTSTMEYKLEKCHTSESFEEAPLWAAIITYLGYLILNIFGWIKDMLRYLEIEEKKGAVDNNPSDFCPLYSEYECFYTRNLYTRIRDCFNRPICSVPGAHISIIERVSDDYNWTFKKSGRVINALNLGSYNYLGFAENSGKCATDSIEQLKEYSVATCASRQEIGWGP